MKRRHEHITLKEKLKEGYEFLPFEQDKKPKIYDGKIYKETKKSHEIFNEFIENFPLRFQKNFYKDGSLCFQEILRSNVDLSPISYKSTDGQSRFLYLFPHNFGEMKDNFMDFDFKDEKYLDQIESKINSIQKVEIDSSDERFKCYKGFSFYDIRMKHSTNGYSSFRIPIVTKDVKMFSVGKIPQNTFDKYFWYEDLRKELEGGIK